MPSAKVTDVRAFILANTLLPKVLVLAPRVSEVTFEQFAKA